MRHDACCCRAPEGCRSSAPHSHRAGWRCCCPAACSSSSSSSGGRGRGVVADEGRRAVEASRPPLLQWRRRHLPVFQRVFLVRRCGPRRGQQRLCQSRRRRGGGLRQRLLLLQGRPGMRRAVQAALACQRSRRAAPAACRRGGGGVVQLSQQAAPRRPPRRHAAAAAAGCTGSHCHRPGLLLLLLQSERELQLRCDTLDALLEVLVGPEALHKRHVARHSRLVAQPSRDVEAARRSSSGGGRDAAEEEQGCSLCVTLGLGRQGR